MKVESESEVAQLCPTLSNPTDCSLQDPSVHGILQAGVLEWGAIPFSTCSPEPLVTTTLLSNSMNLTSLGISHKWKHTVLQYLSFCDWHILLSKMSSRFICVTAYVRISFLLKAEDIPYSTFCLSTHLLIDTWVAFMY